MTRWKLTLEYDGRGFAGWQRQVKDLSVQQVLEESLQKFSGEEIRLFVAGRTDAGVHALAQVAHFDLARATTADEIRGALNYYVKPHPVSVLDVEEVSDAFHARFSAKGRTYRYVIANRRAPLALEAGRAWRIAHDLDLGAMQESAALILGKHDFSTFRAQGCQAKSPIRTLELMDIMRQDDHVILTTSARSFLYHQVRNMVGSLAMVGMGRWSVADFKSAFEACDRAKGGVTSPPDGLYFVGVTY